MILVILFAEWGGGGWVVRLVPLLDNVNIKLFFLADVLMGAVYINSMESLEHRVRYGWGLFLLLKSNLLHPVLVQESWRLSFGKVS